MVGVRGEQIGKADPLQMLDADTFCDAVYDLRPILERVEIGPNETCIMDQPAKTACARLRVRRSGGDRAIASDIEFSASICRPLAATSASRAAGAPS